MPEPTIETKPISIIFEPLGRRTQVETGLTVLEAARTAGVELVALCGGEGACGACRVQLVEGALTPATDEEALELTLDEVAKGFRLACRAQPLQDCRIYIPPESMTTTQRLQVEGQEDLLEADPPVIPFDVHVPPPTMADLRSDLTRLSETITAQGLPAPRAGLPVLAVLSERLRQGKWAARLGLHHEEVVAVLPFDEDGQPPELFGLAVDVGTTKLAAYLVEMSTGHTVARTGEMNPQIIYGEDVISRIRFANQNTGGRQTLQARLVDVINQMTGVLCEEAGIQREQIVEAAIAGNTAMHHLLAGLPVQQLGAAPYVPAVSDALDLPAGEIGLRLAPGAYLHLPPVIAGYVGADHVAMMMATLDRDTTGIRGQGKEKHPRCILALDIGTNTEISLSTSEGRILSCSAASGPAFEGAHIHDGMRAAPGAIERVQIQAGEIRLHVIGDVPPVGICGSGILDAVAALLDAGLIDARGNLSASMDGLPEFTRRAFAENRRQVVLVPAEHSGHGRDIVVSRKDINEIQLAKGAIRAGIDVLLNEAGVTAGDIDELIMAGAFGTYLDLNSAMRVGMLPALPMERVRQVGNAAGTGTRYLLVSTHCRREAAALAEKVEYIELTTHPQFTQRFISALMFDVKG